MIDIKDVDPRKYGKFHAEGNFNQDAFAHLVTRFRQSQSFIGTQHIGGGDSLSARKSRQGSKKSDNSLCYIMQDDQSGANEVL